VWWIPTGSMGRLPLHAAGLHYIYSTNTILDRLVSSHSPSIRILVYACQNSLNKYPTSVAKKGFAYFNALNTMYCTNKFKPHITIQKYNNDVSFLIYTETPSHKNEIRLLYIMFKSHANGTGYDS